MGNINYQETHYVLELRIYQRTLHEYQNTKKNKNVDAEDKGIKMKAIRFHGTAEHI